MSDLPWSDLALMLVASIAAIILHEVSHGVAAWALGDDTARRAGRLTLNPVRHVDQFGTIMLPLLLLGYQLAIIHRVAFMFGWAKPVPVNPLNFRHPRQHMALVAAAGPLCNFLLAVAAAFALLHLAVGMTGQAGKLLTDFLGAFILVNLVLGLFNLLPIPPLDGGRIVVGILPASLAARWARLERVGIVVVLLGVFVLPSVLRSAGIAFDPVGEALNGLLPRAFELVLSLAGEHV